MSGRGRRGREVGGAGRLSWSPRPNSVGLALAKLAAALAAVVLLVALLGGGRSA
jgi:hypothetical protein